MTKVLDWNSNRDMWIRVLKKQTDKDIEYWIKRIDSEDIKNKDGLRTWLTEQGVTGYAANLLVMERFGYPDWVSATADELVKGQYADRLHLQPIYNEIINAVSKLGEFTIQTRKTYVSLLTPRRTFARVKPSTKNRVDVGLRLEGRVPGGRLRPCKLQQTMKVQISLTSLDELDSDALNWLRLAYEENY